MHEIILTKDQIEKIATSNIALINTYMNWFAWWSGINFVFLGYVFIKINEIKKIDMIFILVPFSIMIIMNILGFISSVRLINYFKELKNRLNSAEINFLDFHFKNSDAIYVCFGTGLSIFIFIITWFFLIFSIYLNYDFPKLPSYRID